MALPTDLSQALDFEDSGNFTTSHYSSDSYEEISSPESLLEYSPSEVGITRRIQKIEFVLFLRSSVILTGPCSLTFKSNDTNVHILYMLFIVVIHSI